MKTIRPTPGDTFCGLFGTPSRTFARRSLFCLLAALLVSGGSHVARAQQYITGDIQFNGGATLNTGNLATATALNSIFGPGGPGTLPTVLGGGTQTGDYASVPGGTQVLFQTFSFPSSGNTTPLWTFAIGSTSYNFVASTITVAYQSSYFLDLQGSGVAHIDGFKDTPGVWEITDTGVGSAPVFTFGAATDVLGSQTPEPTAVSLLIISLPAAWLALRARRKNRNHISDTPTE